MSTQNKNAGFLGALTLLVRGLIPVASKVTVLLASGALSGLASTGKGKLSRSGMITISASRKTNVLNIIPGHI